MGFPGNSFPESADDPRLADTGLPRYRYQLRLPLQCLAPAIRQDRNFFLSTDQRRESGSRPRLETIDSSALGAHLVDSLFPGNTLQVTFFAFIDFEISFHQLEGLLADKYLSRFGEGLQPSRQIRCLADYRHLFAARAATDITNHHITRGDTDTYAERGNRKIDLRLQPGNRINHVECSPHGSDGVVLMRMGITEVNQQSVPDIARDDSVVVTDHPGATILVVRE